MAFYPPATETTCQEFLDKGGDSVVLLGAPSHFNTGLALFGWYVTQYNKAQLDAWIWLWNSTH